MAAESASMKVLDFTNVKEGGAAFNKKRVPAGDYLAKVTKVVDAPSKKDEVHQWLYTIELESFHDRKFPYYCKLQENQLWKLRNLFLACGVAIPKRKVKLDPNKVVGKLIGVTMEDDEYDGKAQSNVGAIFPASELSDDNGGEDEDEDAESLEDEDDEATDEAADDEDDAEEGEEEEEPEPAPRAKANIPGQRKSSPAPDKAAARSKRSVEVEDDELEELDLEEI